MSSPSDGPMAYRKRLAGYQEDRKMAARVMTEAKRFKAGHKPLEEAAAQVVAEFRDRPHVAQSVGSHLRAASKELFDAVYQILLTAPLSPLPKPKPVGENQRPKRGSPGGMAAQSGPYAANASQGQKEAKRLPPVALPGISGPYGGNASPYADQAAFARPVQVSNSFNSVPVMQPENAFGTPMANEMQPVPVPAGMSGLNAYLNQREGGIGLPAQVIGMPPAVAGSSPYASNARPNG